MRLPLRYALVAAVAAVGISAGANSPAPHACPPAVGGLPDGDHLFFDFDGVLPGADLLKSFDPVQNPGARVHAVSADPERLVARLLSADAPTIARIEALAGIPFDPVDPAAAEVLDRLAIENLPAVVIVRDGRIHVREGAAAADLAALAGCRRLERKSP